MSREGFAAARRAGRVRVGDRRGLPRTVCDGSIGKESGCLEEGFDAATRVGETGGSSSGAGRRRCAHLATGADARGNVDVGDDGCHGSGDDASVRVDRRGGRCVIIIEDWRRYQSSFCKVSARQLRIALRRVGGVTVGFARWPRSDPRRRGQAAGATRAMPPERGRGGPASTSRAGIARPAKPDDVSRDLRFVDSNSNDGTTPTAPPDATIGVRAREQIEALIATRRDRSSRARPNSNGGGGANLGGGGTNEMARLSSAPETEHAKAATAKALASAHNHEVLRLAALRKDIAPLGSRGTSMDMGGGACGVRASTTRAELELNDRMRVRADDLGVTDDLLHRSDDDDTDEWEEQGLDVGDYGDLAYDVTEPGDDPNAFDLDLDLDSDSDDEDGDGAKTKGGKKGAKGTKGAKTKEKPRRMTKHERAGLVETHKAHLLCLCARALAYDRAASDPFASAMAASMVSLF